MSPRRRAPSPAAGPSAKILVYEKAGSKGSVAVALTGAGHEARRVSSVAELTSQIERGPFEILVLDLASAGVDEAARRKLDAVVGSFLASRRDAPPIILVVTEEPLAGSGPIAEAGLPLSARHREQIPRQIEAALAQRRLEEALGEVARLREAVVFARTTAHDLAQPLTTILARTQLLMRKLPQDDPSRRAVSIVCQEAERLATLIEGFRKLKTMAPAPDPPAE